MSISRVSIVSNEDVSELLDKMLARFVPHGQLLPKGITMPRIVLAFCLSCLLSPLWAMSVAFINPGFDNEVYWYTATRAMQAAAEDLGIRLQVSYADRNYRQALQQVQTLVGLPQAQRPDYVILSNEFGSAAEMVAMLDKAGIRSFLAFSGKGVGAVAADLGLPRQKYPHWLGSLEPRASDAGYLTGQALIARARAARVPRIAGKMPMLVIGGDRSTPTSVLRLQGLYRAVREARDVVVVQEVMAAWSRERAAQQASWLYRRHPQARMVWAGSDQMAMGAMEVWRQRGGQPGKDAFFSGINTSVEAMQLLTEGQLTTLAGGHFITGAWALVMLYDYDRGRDFINEGLELERPLFTRFDAALARRYLQRYSEGDFSSIDFARFSKVHNPAIKRYAFSLLPLLPEAVPAGAVSPK